MASLPSDELRESTNATLVVEEGRRTFVVDVDKRSKREVPMPENGVVHAVVDGVIIAREHVNNTGDFPPLPEPMWALPPPYERLSRLGEASWVLPSLHRDRVWLVSVDESPQHYAGENVVREVRVDGTETWGPTRLPCCRKVIADVEGGVVAVEHRGDEDFRLQVWSLTSRSVRSELGRTSSSGDAAAHGSMVAWVETSDSCGPLHLTDIASGEDRVVTPPAEGRATGDCYEYPEFSWDGRSLAVFRRVDRAEAEINLVDVETGRARYAPGMAAPAYDLAWDQSDQWLFFGTDSPKQIRALNTHDLSLRTISIPFEHVPRIFVS